jgi:hypothetical protein
MARSGFLESLLKLLSYNRDYPKYQHERRIDIFVNYFLRDILSTAFETDIQFVVPEFPLEKANSRRSTNLDYLAYSATDSTVFLCEFKTTHRSFEKEQMERYFLAQKEGWGRILKDVEDIPAGTHPHDRAKYQHLLDKIRNIPPDATIKSVYIAPEAIQSRLDRAASGREYNLLSLETLRHLDIETPFIEEWRLVRSSI